MSTFQVQLTQNQNSTTLGPGPYLYGGPGSTAPIATILTSDGSMDTWAQNNLYANTTVGGVTTGTGGSYQRTIYCMGPNKINRKLKDGQVFVDCNYWKQFCAAPVGPLTPDVAFITLLVDDGSTYIPGQQSSFVRTYNPTIAGATTFTTAGNIINVIGDNGGPALWLTITNNGSNSILVQFNGVATSQFPLAAAATIQFTQGEVQVNTIAFSNNASGAASASVEVLVGVISQCKS